MLHRLRMAASGHYRQDGKADTSKAGKTEHQKNLTQRACLYTMRPEAQEVTPKA
jgi:hypothetical protein